MKKLKRFLIAAAAGLILISSAACSNSAGNEYPVKIAGNQFNEKPQKVICLSDSVADIMIACGYGDSIIARTDECDQPELDGVPSVGSRNNPSYARIESLEPDAIFADKTVSAELIKKLDSNNYKVLNMIKAQNGRELSVLYSSISAVMEGNSTGRQNGEKKASSLLQTFDAMERAIPHKEEQEDSQITACYLYDINGTAATNESLSGQMFKYAKVLNVCASSETSMGSVESIRISNPNFIFCASGVKDQIIKSEKFKDLDAVKNGKIYEIDADEFERQGDSMTENLSFIIQTIYPELKSESDNETEVSESAEPSDSSKETSKSENSKQQSSKQESGKQQSSKQQSSKQESSKKESSKQESSKQESSKQESSKQESSKQESSKTEQTSKVKADTSLKITEDTAYGQGDVHEDIKKIQQRLKDLGYGKFEDGITDYFGEKTTEAFKAFQKKNGLDTDGYAGPEALKLLFSDKAKRAS